MRPKTDLIRRQMRDAKGDTLRLLYVLQHLENNLIAKWCSYNLDIDPEKWWYKYGIVITDLLRSVARAIRYGRPDSSHVYGRAADIRCYNYTPEQIKLIVAFLEHHWGPMIHVLHHDSGRGAHIHININRGFSRERWKENV